MKIYTWGLRASTQKHIVFTITVPDACMHTSLSYTCMSIQQRERQRQTDRQTDRETETDRQRRQRISLNGISTVTTPSRPVTTLYTYGDAERSCTFFAAAALVIL